MDCIFRPSYLVAAMLINCGSIVEKVLIDDLVLQDASGKHGLSAAIRKHHFGALSHGNLFCR